MGMVWEYSRVAMKAENMPWLLGRTVGQMEAKFSLAKPNIHVLVF